MAKKLSIDLNCDMGESYGRFKVGNDEAIFPLINSCNIACGFHAGDPLHLDRTIDLAIANHCRIGAHPSYPDLAGFGRRTMQIPADELYALIRYQVSALKGMVESKGGRLVYVKPHGALYNSLAGNREEAKTVIRAVRSLDPELAFMGLAGSVAEECATELGVSFIAEAFADRVYTPEGKLRSRSLPGAVIHDPEKAARQVYDMMYHKQLKAYEGTTVSIDAQSVCIHGDNPAAVSILEAIHAIC